MPESRRFSAAPTRALFGVYIFFWLVELSLLSFSDPGRTITIEDVGSSDIVPTEVLLTFRLMTLTTVYASLGRRLLETSGSYVEEMPRFPGSHLRPMCITIGGHATFTTFTVLSWLLQGVYLTAAATCSAAELTGYASAPLSRWLPRTAQILFEASVPSSMLVSTVITFVIIPAQLQRGVTPYLFFATNQQLMHCANLYVSLTELVFNRIPILPADVGYALLVGLLYLPLMWWFARRTHIVWYSFLDPTIPPRASLPNHISIFCCIACYYAVAHALRPLLWSSAAVSVPLPLRIALIYMCAYPLVWTRRRGVPLSPDGRQYVPWSQGRLLWLAGRRPLPSPPWRSLEGESVQLHVQPQVERPVTCKAP